MCSRPSKQFEDVVHVLAVLVELVVAGEVADRTRTDRESDDHARTYTERDRRAFVGMIPSR